MAPQHPGASRRGAAGASPRSRRERQGRGATSRGTWRGTTRLLLQKQLLPVTVVGYTLAGYLSAVALREQDDDARGALVNDSQAAAG